MNRTKWQDKGGGHRVQVIVKVCCGSGVNSESNRHELTKACGTYLLATRVASVKEIKDIVLSQPGRYRELSDPLKEKEGQICLNTFKQSARPPGVWDLGEQRKLPFYPFRPSL